MTAEVFVCEVCGGRVERGGYTVENVDVLLIPEHIE